MNECARMPVVAFLPCRAGSERVPRKNVQPFAGVEGGLTRIKLDQLLGTKRIDQIIVSTDDEEVRLLAREAANANPERIKMHDRPAELATSGTSTDALIRHVPNLIEGEAHVLWTHVTSPFVGAELYDQLISEYHKRLAGGHSDSLMTVTAIRNFLWTAEGPANYDRTVEKWPRTQTLPINYIVNSAAFLAPLDVYRNGSDRIGERPFLFEIDEGSAVDIDWPKDFELAECIWKGLRR